MRVLITGGAGYIGSHVAVELLTNGHTPIIVDNLVNAHKSVLRQIEKITNKKPIFYEGDVCDKTFLSDVLTQEPAIDGVIHFAAYKAVGESLKKPLTYYHNNLLSLITVLDLAKRHMIKHVVFSSSATVYGNPITNPIPETAPRQEATNPYGNTKAIAEDIIRDTAHASKNLKAIALRYFNPIGAHPSAHIGELPLGTPANLVPYLTQVAAGKRDALSVFGDDYDTPDGTGVRDFIHVVDLAKAHIATLKFLSNKKDSSYYDVYNVGTGTGTSVKELITTFEKVTGVNVPYHIAPRRPGDIATCWADPTKIKKDMHWEASYTIEDALRHAWQWQQTL